MNFERTRNSSRNIIFGSINRVVSILFPFIMRSIIIEVLGGQYLGLNSLFTSILQVLNLAELGFESAIIYSMYEPIAKDEYKKINALLKLYRKIYRIIGTGILIVGLCLAPFIDFFVKDSIPLNVNIHLFFLLYLLNTSISYLLFAYKRSLLTAHQRTDIIEKVSTVVRIVTSVVQLLLLIILKDFMLYVLMNLVYTIVDNIICSIIVNRRYPEYYCEGNLDKKTRQEITKRVGALAIQRFGSTISLSLDNIIISRFLGLSLVAVYGNYYYILSAVTHFLVLIYGSVTAGIGNSIIVESKEKNYKDFNKLIFINAWIVGWCSICLICLYQHFMIIWVGTDMMLNVTTVLLLVSFFYIAQTRKIVLTYKDGNGMWWEDKYKPIVGCGINLILNLLLVSKMGINGVILSTIVSYLFVEMPWETRVFFKSYFNRSESSYYLKLVVYTALVGTVGVLTYYICSLLPNQGLIWFIVKIIVCIVVPNICFITLSFNTNEYKYFSKKIRKVVTT